jgi:hypothetical protein
MAQTSGSRPRRPQEGSMAATWMEQRRQGAELGHAEIDRVERRLERLATVLDSAIAIPGTRIRLGADSLLGLLPGIGDLVGIGLSGYIIMEARRLGAPATTLARMVANVAIDGVIGAIPIVGDLFDIAFKANRRNVALLREHLADLRTRVAKDITPGARPAGRT